MTEKKLEIKNLKKIDLPKVDVTKYIGTKAIVDEAELKSKEYDGKLSYYVQYSALVDPTGFNGKPLYATKQVGVQVDENEQVGWGESTKMDKFLKFHEVATPNELIGKTVIVQAQPESTYLTF
jgi:hypothetical protein